MKTIKNSKDITTLEVGDVVVFGDLKYEVAHSSTSLDGYYYLHNLKGENDVIFEKLNTNKKYFIACLGIVADCSCDFPEVKSLEALTAIVSALFKEYEKQNELPKTWEEFCEKYHLKEEETFIKSDSELITVGDYISRKFRLRDIDRNLCTSKQEAEAFLALMQLRQLRKAYVKDWEPDWENGYKYKYGINFSSNKLMVLEWCETSCTLSFPTEKLAEQFLTNFKNLLEIAKPLL